MLSRVVLEARPESDMAGLVSTRTSLESTLLPTRLNNCTFVQVLRAEPAALKLPPPGCRLPLERLGIVTPIPAPVQGLERGLLHCAPRRRLPARSLLDRVLRARHEHRHAQRSR